MGPGNAPLCFKKFLSCPNYNPKSLSTRPEGTPVNRSEIEYSLLLLSLSLFSEQVLYKYAMVCLFLRVSSFLRALRVKIKWFRGDRTPIGLLPCCSRLLRPRTVKRCFLLETSQGAPSQSSEERITLSAPFRRLPQGAPAVFDGIDRIRQRVVSNGGYRSLADCESAMDA